MRIGSAGKTFSLTGWKVGYVSAPAALIGMVAKAHQNLTFTTRAQPAARGRLWAWPRTTPISRAWPAELQAQARPRCRADGARVRRAAGPGSYFITADFSPLGFAGDDAAFCRAPSPRRPGVAAIPGLGLL